MSPSRIHPAGRRDSGALTRSAAERQAEIRGRDTARYPAAVPRLRHQLRDLRLHTDAEGARMAEEEHARAVTIGKDIYFNRGEFAPDKAEGRELLGHELTHVEQQVEGRVPAGPQQDTKKDTKQGLGSSPPDIEFTRAEGPASEQEHVLFAYDSDKLSPNDRKKIESWAKGRFMPVIVELHGYASHEGKDEYNVNLSAHRAAAVKFAIEGALPLGSRVEVVAHGETGGFETPDENRRVGLSARMKPLELTPPSLGFGGLGQRAPGLGLGGQQPFLTPPAPVLPPSLFPPPVVSPPEPGPRAPGVDLGGPLPYEPRYPQWTAPELYRFRGGAEPEPSWPELAAPFGERGLSMGEGDAEVMRRLATQNLGLLNLTEGLYGGPYNWARRTFKFLDLDPLEVAKPKWAGSLAGSAAGSQLARDNPTPLEAFNREGLKYDLPEPTVLPLPSVSFDLQSDAVKKSQEAAKRREEAARKKKGNE